MTAATFGKLVVSQSDTRGGATADNVCRRPQSQHLQDNSLQVAHLLHIAWRWLCSVQHLRCMQHKKLLDWAPKVLHAAILAVEQVPSGSLKDD